MHNIGRNGAKRVESIESVWENCVWMRKVMGRNGINRPIPPKQAGRRVKKG
jgi:hypothetical protein